MYKSKFFVCPSTRVNEHLKNKSNSRLYTFEVMHFVFMLHSIMKEKIMFDTIWCMSVYFDQSQIYIITVDFFMYV